MGVQEGPQDAAPVKVAGMGSRRSIVARGVFSTVSGTVVSNITGLGRQLVFAWIYGAGRNMDAFLIASVVSQIVFLSVDSALSATLIPVYSKLRAESEENAKVFLAAVSSLVTAFTALAGVSLYFAAPILVRLLAPGFQPAEARQATLMLRVMMPSLVFMGLSSVSVGYLQTRGRFGDPAAMFIPRNIVLILGAALMGRHFGIGVLAWGTLAGAVLQLVTVLRPALRMGIPRHFVWQPLHSGIRAMLVRLPAVFVNFFMYQAALIVDRILASGLPGGMIASLSYAQILLGPPLALIGSLGVALFPTLSDMVAQRHGPELSRAVSTALQLSTFFAMPLCLLIILFRGPLVAAVYGHGAFGVVARSRTAFALAFFAAGAVSMVWNGILGRTFFALGETRVLMISGAWAVGTTIIADLILIHPLRQGGLALGTSLGSWVSTFVMLRLVSHRLEGFRPDRLLGQLLGSALLATVAYSAVAVAAGRWLPSPESHGLWIRIAVFLVGAVVGTGLYLGLYGLFAGGRSRLREIWSLGRQVLSRATG